MQTETLDTIVGLNVDHATYFNEMRTLRMLFKGMAHLMGTLKAREYAVEQQGGNAVRGFSFGLDVDGTKDKLDLWACYFHWFGVSICNFARLVGYVHGLEVGEFTRLDVGDRKRCDAVRDSVDRYVNGVTELADVLTWRNKVGAHFAITAPKPSDNPATLDMSVMYPITFSRDRYRVGTLTILRSTGGASHTSEIPSWSVTDVFETLEPRYWPGVKWQPAHTELGNEQP